MDITIDIEDQDDPFAFHSVDPEQHYYLVFDPSEATLTVEAHYDASFTGYKSKYEAKLKQNIDARKLASHIEDSGLSTLEKCARSWEFEVDALGNKHYSHDVESAGDRRRGGDPVASHIAHMARRAPSILVYDTRDALLDEVERAEFDPREHKEDEIREVVEKCAQRLKSHIEESEREFLEPGQYLENEVDALVDTLLT
jgi:hypothetical protein